MKAGEENEPAEDSRTPGASYACTEQCVDPKGDKQEEPYNTRLGNIFGDRKLRSGRSMPPDRRACEKGNSDENYNHDGHVLLSIIDKAWIYFAAPRFNQDMSCPGSGFL
jgi:hypothetical protein